MDIGLTLKHLSFPPKLKRNQGLLGCCSTAMGEPEPVWTGKLNTMEERIKIDSERRTGFPSLPYI